MNQSNHSAAPAQATTYTAVAVAELIHVMNPTVAITGAMVLAMEQAVTQGMGEIAMDAALGIITPAAAQHAIIEDTIYGDLPGLGGHLPESTLAQADFAIELIGTPGALDLYLGL
jgi:hypothetical protein